MTSRLAWPAGYDHADLAPPARWEPTLGEFIFDWDDPCRTTDPHRTAVAFAQSAVRHACVVCDCDPMLSSSVDGVPPPVS